MLIRSITAIAVVYMLIGTLVKGFEVAWRLSTQGAMPPWPALATCVAVVSLGGGWAVGFVAGHAPLRHASILATLALGLAALMLVLPGGPTGGRLTMLSCHVLGVLLGGALRHLQMRSTTTSIMSHARPD